MNIAFSSSSLIIISSYLKHKTQRTKINDCFSTRSNIEDGVPQGSILGPLLFNINMIDLFHVCEENDIETMLTIQFHIVVVLTFLLSFLNYRMSQQKFLIGLVIII